MTEGNFEICSFNCNGLADYSKRKDIFDFLRAKNFNIYLLQETHWTTDQENFIRSNWGFEVFCSGDSTNSKGVSILFSNNFEYKLYNCIKDIRGCYILLDLEICKKRVTLLNIYGPSTGDNLEFWNEIDDLLENQNADNIIIGGDWNCTLNMNLDNKNYINNLNRPNTREKIKDLMVKYELIDIWRTHNPEKRKFTWRKFNSNKRARLDFFLITENLQSDINKSDIDMKYRSDHSIITLALKQEGFKRGKPYWKFNNSLLKNIDYVETVKKVIIECKKEYCALSYNIDNIKNIKDEELILRIGHQLFLEMLLLNIRLKTINFSSNLRKQENERYKLLLQRIKELEEKIDETGAKDELETLNNELLEIRSKKIQGTIIRSRVQWLKEGERGTKYFCSLEKRNYINKTMPFLELENGDRIFEQKAIAEEVRSFYEKLYSEHQTEDRNLSDILPGDTPKLSDAQKDEISKNLTLEELSKVLYNMKNDKSPGSDGYTVEFFKFFFKDLGIYVLKSLIEGFSIGELSASQKQGVIVCIPKENKPKMYLKNWRPISLLNITYKLGSGILANRLKAILPSIINDCQKGFLKGRYIGENIRLIHDIMIHTETNNIPGLLMSIDYQKAFDSISWRFIEKAMEFFNFGDVFINFFRTIYKNTESNIYINGQYSSWFRLNRGVRQGDPCSPYLYLIGAEVLSIMLRSNRNIKGIKVQDKEYILSQFADDTALCLDGSEESFIATIETLDNFSALSGLLINNEKTQLLWLGSRKNSNIKYMRDRNFTWDPGIITLLGIKLSAELGDIININYQNKLAEVEQILMSWQKRNLTPFGKTTIIKTLAIPKVLYLFINLPDPTDKFISDLEKIIFNFLWNNKPAKINKSTVKLEYEEGGLNMLDIKAFLTGLKLTWLKRFYHNQEFHDNTIKFYPELERLKHCAGDIVGKINVQNLFWQHIIKHYNKLSVHCQPMDNTDFISESLFYNKNIQIGNNTLFIKQWYDAGITKIGHLMINQRSFMTYQQFRGKYPTVLTNFLLFRGIIHAIKFWANHLNLNLEEGGEFRVQTKLWKNILQGNQTVKKCLRQNDKTHSAILKWNRTYQEIIWQKIFANIYKTTLDTKLRWLQLRIIYRIIPTNRLLFLQRIKPNEVCTFCQIAIENIQHLFWECRHINDFWKRLQERIKDTCPSYDNMPDFTEKYIILGYSESFSNDTILSLIVLIGKYFIYTQKLQDSIPTLLHFIPYLKSKLDIERRSKSLKAYDSFCKKLRTYENLFI